MTVDEFTEKASSFLVILRQLLVTAGISDAQVRIYAAVDDQGNPTTRLLSPQTMSVTPTLTVFMQHLSTCSVT